MTTDATGTAPATGEVRESASAFDKFLSLVDSEDKQGEVEAQAETQGEEPGEEANAAGEEEAPEGAEAEAGDESAEDASEGEGADDKLFTVRVDGTELQVSESELIAGYSRQQDYTRKTQALASERKTLEQARAVIHQERTEYANLLPQLRAALEAGMKEPDWEALRQQDPVKASIEWQRFNDRKAKIAAVRQEEERVQQAQSQDNAELRNQVLIEERQKLFARPEMAHWKDGKKASAESQAIAQTLLNAGFTEAELEIYDHRAMLIAWKASQYDQLSQQRTTARAAVRTKVERAPVAKPGGGAAPPQKGAGDKARERLAKSGNVHDAAEFFFHQLS